MIGRPLVAIDRVGIGELPQRRQVRHARHRHEVAGRRVVAERQERQRAGRPLAGGDERGERRIGQAVELAGRHVAGAGRVVVDRVVEPIEHEQLVAELGVEILVAHPALDVLRGRGELVRAVREDVAFLVEAVDAADALGVHQVRRVPAAGGVEDDVVRPLVGLVLRLPRGPAAGQAERNGQAEAGQAAEFEEIASHVA